MSAGLTFLPRPTALPLTHHFSSLSLPHTLSPLPSPPLPSSPLLSSDGEPVWQPARDAGLPEGFPPDSGGEDRLLLARLQHPGDPRAVQGETRRVPTVMKFLEKF